MPNTPNFNWPTPADTDYVTNGALAMRDLGDGIDTSLVDLKGGTMGQVLAKASNTDLDYVWTTPNPGDVTAVNVTSPLTGGGTGGDVTVGIQDGTTTQKGAVQLEDSTASTSTTKAATPNSVKSAYDLANGAIAKTTVTTAGDIIYRNGSAPTRLGIGTAGQVLTVNSGATAPEWATPSSAGGGMTLLSTTSLSGVTTTVSGISGGYKNLIIFIKDYLVTSDFNCLVFINGDTTGSNYQQYVLRASQGTPAPYSDGSSAGVDISGYALDANGQNYFCAMTINDYANSTTYKTIQSTNIAQDNNGSNKDITLTAAGYWGTTAITSIGVKTTVGTWGAGTIEIYGVK